MWSSPTARTRKTDHATASEAPLRRGHRRLRHQRRDHRRTSSAAPASACSSSRPAPARTATLRGYEDYLNRFYATASKDNQSPYPLNPDAPMPRGTDARKIRPGQPDASAYLVQNGPFATDTTYTRVLGGTTMHWEGKTPRMLPEDFELARALRPGRRLAGRLRRPRAVLRAGGARDRRLGGRRPTRPTSASRSSPATCSRCAACRSPTSTRWWPRASTARRSSSTASRSSSRCGRSRRGATGSPTPTTTAARASRPVGAVIDLAGRGGRTLPGQHQLRPDLPGPGQVQRRQDAREGAADAAASTCSRRRSPPRSSSIPTRAASRTSSTRPTASRTGTRPGRCAGASSCCAPTRSRTRG